MEKLKEFLDSLSEGEIIRKSNEVTTYFVNDLSNYHLSELINEYKNTKYLKYYSNEK